MANMKLLISSAFYYISGKAVNYHCLTAYFINN